MYGIVWLKCQSLFWAQIAKEMEDPSRRAVLSLVAGGLAVGGVNAALKASDERYAAFGSSSLIAFNCGRSKDI